MKPKISAGWDSRDHSLTGRNGIHRVVIPTIKAGCCTADAKNHNLREIHHVLARIQEVGAGALAHPWGGVSPFEMHYSIAFKHQFLTGRPPLGEILYPPLM